MIVKYEDDGTKKTYGWVEGLFKLWGLNISDEIVMEIEVDGGFDFKYNGVTVGYYNNNVESIVSSKEVFLQWMEDKPQYHYEELAKEHVQEMFNLC